MTPTGTRNIARGKNMVSSRIRLVSHLKAPVWIGRSWPDRLLASELRTLLDFWGKKRWKLLPLKFDNCKSSCSSSEQVSLGFCCTASYFPSQFLLLCLLWRQRPCVVGGFSEATAARVLRLPSFGWVWQARLAHLLLLLPSAQMTAPPSTSAPLAAETGLRLCTLSCSNLQNMRVTTALLTLLKFWKGILWKENIFLQYFLEMCNNEQSRITIYWGQRVFCFVLVKNP